MADAGATPRAMSSSVAETVRELMPALQDDLDQTRRASRRSRSPGFPREPLREAHDLVGGCSATRA